MKPQWVDAHVNNFSTIQARELKFCVCYLREKSAPLTNFQPNWTTTGKVSDFGHFICRVSSPIVGGGGGVGCVYLTHILQKPCSTTTMAVYAMYEATAKKIEFTSGKSRLATLF